MISLSSLFTRQTKQTLYDVGLGVATALGLPVTSWHTGDPTRSSYWFVAEVLEQLEAYVLGLIAAAFLDLAASDERYYGWLVIGAEQRYGYVADVATYASASSGITLSNGGGGRYVLAVRDVTFRCSATGKTYHNTSSGTLESGPGTTLTLDVEADETGTESNAAVGEIDEIVTTLLGVTCTNAVAVTGTDNETAASIVAGCRAKLGPLSPNGPADAYNSIATDASLTGTNGITKSRTYGDSATGDVTVYLGGPSGPVSGADVALADAAIATWATPWCITPTVASATGVTQAVTYELWVYDSIGMTEAELEAAIEVALQTWFSARPIGGDIKASVGTGKLFVEGIKEAIKAVCGSHLLDLAMTVPAADADLTVGQIAALGAVTATAIHFEAKPTVIG